MQHEVEGFGTRDQQGDTELARLHSTLLELKKQLDRYSRFTSLAVEGRYLDAQQVLSKTGNPVPKFLESLTATKSAVESFPVQSHVQEAANRSKLHYHETLEGVLDESGLRRNGQWPSYVIEDVVRLELNLERYEALIDGKGAGSLEPTRLVDRIKTRLNELFDESLDVVAFLGSLQSAQEKVAIDQGQTSTDYVDIRKVYGVIRSRGERGRYSEDKFGADVYRLFCEGPPETPEGQTLELSPAQSASGGIYIPAPRGGNYIAAYVLLMEFPVVDQTGPVSPLSRTTSRSIIGSLVDGVVPRVGAHLFTAGRERWLQSLEEDLEDLADEASLDGRLRIINGRNGDGKTHLMHLLKQQALDAGFAVSYVVISDQVPLHRWDLVYGEIGRSLSTRSQPDAPGLRTILNPRSPDPSVVTDFMQKAISARTLGGIHPSFAEVIYRYCTEQTVNVDAEQDMLLLGSWLEGHSHRLAGMGVGGVVDRTNGAAMLRSLALTLQHFGFHGLVILVDEVESVLNQTTPRRRESYQTLRLLVDRENMPVHTLVAASTTPPMYTDQQRGMSTYPALWSRVRNESPSDFVNYNATLIDLTPNATI